MTFQCTSNELVDDDITNTKADIVRMLLWDEIEHATHRFLILLRIRGGHPNFFHSARLRQILLDPELIEGRDWEQSGALAGDACSGLLSDDSRQYSLIEVKALL